jgi:dolichyl-diphosphooligosaccharide--protein glycosyltransferase
MVNGSTVLFRAGNFNFYSRYLLVILVLAIAFTTSFIIRFYPAKYGFYLNEADPFFNYRATKFIIDNGLDTYWGWHDDMSWYPEGRDILRSSQSGLHIISAYLYSLFASRFATLLEFTIMFPVVIGSLTAIILFVLVRLITGSNTAGMFSALLFAFSPAIIQRGNLGWFKSEPLGLFLALIALCLFISALKNKEIKYAILKSAVAGIVLGLANTSWGGIQYFSIPISLFLIALPFLRKDLQIPVCIAITLTLFTIITAAAFPRPGISFMFGLPGIALIGSTVFLINAHFLKNLSSPQKLRLNTVFLLTGFFGVGVAALMGGAYYTSDFRYLNAINPFLSPQTSITEFVAEHATPTMVDYFLNYSVLLFFAGLGAWLAFTRNNYMLAFALLVGITGVYVSGGLIRLLVYASIGIIILAGIGLHEITRTMFKTRIPIETYSTNLRTKGMMRGEAAFKVAYPILIILVLLIPMVYPRDLSWTSLADIPPTIISAKTNYNIESNDWLHALDWISKNTPKGSVFAAWWDYGYWITVLGNRTSLADNSTINQTRIATIAKMFMQEPEAGIITANKTLKADYILIYLVAQPIFVNNTSYYILGYSGDESNIPAMIGLAGLDEGKYIEHNVFTDLFWNNTLIGSLMPFVRQGYSLVDEDSPSLLGNYSTGASSVYFKKIKYPENNASNPIPLELVYSSPSFSGGNGSNSSNTQSISAILIYKINHRG